jgi:hypothetical protein
MQRHLGGGLVGLVAAALVACFGCSPSPLQQNGAAGSTGGGAGSTGTGAGSSGGSGAIVGAGGSGIFVSPPADAGPDVALEPGSPDANPALPATLVVVPPPEVSCTGQVDAAVECDLPLSTCAVPSGCTGDLASCMARSGWLVYYENPRCVDRRCVWDQAYFQCESGSYCSKGACSPLITTG